MSLTLYHFPLSGHAHRARLFLSLIGVEARIVDVDLVNKAHKAPDFLAMNLFGQVPVLEDDGVVIPDSNAILVYLAKKYGRTDWLPEDAVASAQIQRWLSVAAGQLASGPAAARMITLFKAPYDAEATLARAHALLAVLETHLTGHTWLVGSGPTIADIALYSYVAHAPEGNVALAPYPAVQRWLAGIEALPGFVGMPRSAIGLAA